jgi:3-oxoacyl-[acyl-carrier-protein] synthase-3
VTALESVAVHVPEVRVPIGSLRERLGVTAAEMRIFERFYGLAEVPQDDGDLTDLLWRAVTRLELPPERAKRIRYVLHARSINVITPYPVNPLHDITTRLGLGHAAAFSVSQHACASGLLAVDLAGRLLAAGGDPDARALVLTGEKTFTRGAMLIPRNTIFGEASAAVVVRPGGERDRLVTYAVAMRGEYDMTGISDAMAEEYREAYPGLVGETVRAAVERAGLRLADVALILPHNSNTFSWRVVCDLIDFPKDRVLLENVPVTGHVFCSSGFVNYRTAVDSGRLRPGDHYVMASVGIGATFAAMVFRH